MEKVKVVKAIPGILNVGDYLTAPIPGSDFKLEETKITNKGSNERYISLDYVSVSENIPEFFELATEALLEDIEIDDSIQRSESQIDERYDFFKEQYENAAPGSEEQIVYKNLMWLIEWLYGKAELV